MANTEIRRTAAAEGVRLWQIADRLGIQDTGLSKKMRHELPEEEKEKILLIIAEIAKGGR